MFAAAFVLVLADIITPVTAETTDLSKTFTLMDEMILRGISIAGPYKRDLLELVELHGKLNGNQPHETAQQGIEAFPTSQTDTQTGSIRQFIPDISEPQINPDTILPWMETGSEALGVLHPDTIQSAIDGLNFDFLDDPSAIEMGGNEWMWGTGLSVTSNWPNQP